MNLQAAFSRATHSSSLRFVVGSAIYGLYLNSKEMIVANLIATVAVIGVNLSKRSAPYEFVPTGISNVASGAICITNAAHHIAIEGMTLSNWGRLSVGTAYLCWAGAEVLKTRLNLKGIETPDKKWLNPNLPNAVADILAVGNFPPLMITTALTLLKDTFIKPVEETAPVSTPLGFLNKHISGTRLLGAGMLAAGITGAFTGLGAYYTAAFLLWTAGYVGFEPERNKALRQDIPVVFAPKRTLKG